MKRAIVLLLACACAPSGVKIGSKKFTESVLLGEIATQLLRSQGQQATHRAQLGGTQVLWHALLAGEIDAYPEYTATLREDVLHADPATALASHGVSMTASLGFEDTYALGMREDEASRLGIASISDLAGHPELKIGLSEEFLHRADGWPALQKRYGLAQKDIRTLDHDLGYRALASGALDVMGLYSTDAEIAYYRLRVLKDDLHLFPSYEAVFLYRTDKPVPLEPLQGRIDAASMRRLNAQAKLDHVPEVTVAAGFLSTLGVASEAKVESVGHQLARNLLEHLFLVAVSLGAAILLAVPLGILAARRKRLGALILGVAGIVQTIPSLALLVFMIPFLGIGTAPAVAALFLYSVLPIVRNTAEGLGGVPVALLESADVLGLSRRARLINIELPLASPSILAGIQTSAVINVGTATLGALIGAGGLGQPIITGIRLDDVRMILEGAIPAALLALVIQGLFGALSRWVIPKGLRL